MPGVELEGREAVLRDDVAERVARRLAALGEPTRLKLAAELRTRGDASVKELTDAVGGSLPNISKHLQILHQGGIVTRHKEGTTVRYRIADGHVGALLLYALRILGVGSRRSG